MLRFAWVVVLGVALSPSARGQAPAGLKGGDGPGAGTVPGGGAGIGTLVDERAASPPASDAAWREFRGKVVVSDMLLASQFGSEQVRIASLHRVQRAAVTGTDGFWRLHFVAFLNRPAASETVNLVAYETGDKGRQPVKVFEVPVQPGAKELHLNNFVVAESMGFHRGQSYDLVVEAPGSTHGKQDVAARGMITLR